MKSHHKVEDESVGISTANNTFVILGSSEMSNNLEVIALSGWFSKLLI